MKLRIPFITLAALTVASAAAAAPVLRHQEDLRGDFVMLGNTLAHDCRGGVPAPVVGTVGSCGSDLGDTSPDVFWRADAPAAGNATTTALAIDARSTALLGLPAGATVTYARLYWAAEASTGMADTLVTLERDGVFSDSITADDTWSNTVGGFYYQATADVTTTVQLHGAGAYRVADVDTVALADVDDEVVFSGWAMVVVYSLPTDPSRNITLFDGFDRVSNGSPAPATLSGFLVPNAGFDAKLGVLAYEGDASINGDNIRFGTAPLNAADRLTDALNPANDFFNGTRSTLGIVATNVGDLPELVGTAGSLSGVDMDVVDITSRLSPGQTSADIEARSSGDVYYLGAFVSSISAFKPELGTSSTKSAVDLDGGEFVRGEEIVYVFEIENDGNDTAINTMLTDTLPSQVSYVADSLEITAGANVGALTDAADGDEGEVVGADVTVRLGTLAPGESTTVELRVVLDEIGTVSNQALIDAAGLLGSPAESFMTDGDPLLPGAQETIVEVYECDTDDDCPTGVCIDLICIEDPGTGGAGGAGGFGGAGMGGNALGGNALGGHAPGGGEAEPFGRYEGSGCRCRATSAAAPASGAPWLWWLAALALARRRRRS